MAAPHTRGGTIYAQNCGIFKGHSSLGTYLTFCQRRLRGAIAVECLYKVIVDLSAHWQMTWLELRGNLWLGYCGGYSIALRDNG